MPEQNPPRHGGVGGVRLAFADQQPARLAQHDEQDQSEACSETDRQQSRSLHLRAGWAAPTRSARRVAPRLRTAPGKVSTMSSAVRGSTKVLVPTCTALAPASRNS